MPLTSHQRMAIPVIEWLTSTDYPNQDASSGRTTAFMYVFMRRACNSPGRPVSPYDHTHPISHHRQWQYMKHVIMSLAKSEPEFSSYDFKINESHMSISATIKPLSDPNTRQIGD